MRWRLYVGLAIVAAASIAAVVIAITSVTGGDDLQRVKSALQLQTNCARVTVTRPSREVEVRRWTGLTTRSGDVACAAGGPRVSYAKFIDQGTLVRAVIADPPAAGYCRLGDAVLIARRVGAASTVLSDVCQSVGGTLVLTSAD